MPKLTEDTHTVKTQCGLVLTRVTAIMDYGITAREMPGARTFYVNGQSVAFWSYVAKRKNGEIINEKIEIIY